MTLGLLGVGNAGIKTLAFQGHSEVTSSASPTYSSAPIGEASADRIVIVGIGLFTVSAVSLSSVTVGGNSATAIVSNTANTNHQVFIYALNVATGTSADVVVNWSGSADATGIAVWSATGTLGSTTANDTQTTSSDGGTMGLSTVTNGFLIAMTKNNASGPDASWTGATEEFDLSISSNDYSGADASQTSAGTTNVSVTASGSPTVFASCAAAW